MIAPGRLLLRTVENSAEIEESDPVLEGFLAFLAAQMKQHPERVRALNKEDVDGIDELLGGVEYDPGERLDDDFDLP